MKNNHDKATQWMKNRCIEYGLKQQKEIKLCNHFNILHTIHWVKLSKMEQYERLKAESFNPHLTISQQVDLDTLAYLILSDINDPYNND